MKFLSKLNVGIALLSAVSLISGAVSLERTNYGHILMYTGLGLAILFTLLALLDIRRMHSISDGRKLFWTIMIVSVPMLGGLLFYLIHFGVGTTATFSD